MFGPASFNSSEPFTCMSTWTREEDPVLDKVLGGVTWVKTALKPLTLCFANLFSNLRIVSMKMKTHPATYSLTICILGVDGSSAGLL